MKKLSLTILFAGLISACGQGGGIQKITNRGGEKVTSQDLKLSKLSKTCEKKNVLNLNTLIDRLKQKGSEGARLYTRNLRAFDTNSNPPGSLQRLNEKESQASLLKAIGLEYDSGQLKSLISDNSLLDVYSQDCEEVKFRQVDSNATGDDSDDNNSVSFIIDLEQSTENKLVLEAASGEIRVYQVANNTLDIEVFEDMSLATCEGNSEVLSASQLRLSWAGDLESHPLVGRELIEAIATHTSTSENLKRLAQTERQGSHRVTQANRDLVVQESLYIDAYQDLFSENSSFSLNCESE